MKVCLFCNGCFDSRGWTCVNCGKEPRRSGGFFVLSSSAKVADDGFAPYYFSELSELEGGHFWFRGRNDLIQWTVGHHFEGAKTFLEVGCGTGFVLSALHQRFPRLLLTGTDLFVEGLHFARGRLPGVELFQMDARTMPFTSEFDVIGAFDVLEHIDDDERVLAEFYRSCRPGGGIVVTVPQHPFLWSATDEYARHKRRYTRRDLVSKIKRAGFTTVRVTSFVSLLLPLLLISRKRRGHLDARFNALQELRTNTLASVVLEQLLRLERRLIQSGVAFPVGGSLLAVAQRQGSGS